MAKTKVAIIGFGNIGKDMYEAILTAPDMELTGVVLRDKTTATKKGVPTNITVVENISELGHVDVAMLCIPSMSVPDVAENLLIKGIRTVDSYDVHSNLYDVRERLKNAAVSGNSVAVVGAGWDPGTDSMIRGILEFSAPKGLTFTNFGPGMSMGHTVAVKAIEGVKKALSVTIPLGTGLHRRMVYVELDEPSDSNFNKVSKAIKESPYFANDETHVIYSKDVDSLQDRGHSVNMVRKGVSGVADNQRFEFNMSINNPALTAQIMLAAGRATMRQTSGCYTMIELPIIDMLYGDKEDIIRRLV